MKLQSQILTYLKQQPKTWAIKVEVANQRGCPDILLCCSGKFIAIEVKQGKDKVSPIQAEQMKLIRNAGGDAWIITDFKVFKMLFEELK